MSDYCFSQDVTPCHGKKKVRLSFLRKELLYDIKNYAFIEGDVLGEERQHAQHVLVDIGEDGNVDRVTRLLNLYFTKAVELLSPITRVDVICGTSLDDRLSEPDSYVIDLYLPSYFSQTSVYYLKELIHNYLIDMVLYDWLSITNPDASGRWLSKAEDAEAEISKLKVPRGVFTRKTHPW